MKKLMVALLSVSLLLGTLAGCGSGNVDTSGANEESQSKTKKIEPISIICGSTNAEGFRAVMEKFAEKHTGAETEIMISGDTTQFETVMTAKIASNDLPDIITMQVGSIVKDYAANGYIVPITDLGIQENLIDGDTSLLQYDNNYFAIPSDISFSGVFVNKEALAEFGVELDPIPQSVSEFTALCDKLQQAGMESPIVIGAKEASPATAFVFQYVYQNVYGADPNWYANVLRGKTGWNGPEFEETFVAYEKLMPYVNKDALGLDGSGAQKRFVTNQAAFIFDTAGILPNMRKIAPDLDITIIPPPFCEDKKDMTAIVNFDGAVAISKQAKDPELCKEFLSFFFTPEMNELFCQTTQFNPVILGAEVETDPAASYYQKELLAGAPTCAMLSREWIPGVKEIMKKGTQNWFSGMSADEVCDTIEAEHKRLMEANPNYVESFLKDYVDVK